MTGELFLSLLQFTDGLFPAGSYAHSFGLESYAAEGTVTDAPGVEAFLRAYLQGSVAPTDAIAAVSARRAAIDENPAALEQCLAIDRKLDAMKSASELRDASRQMGRQVLCVAANLQSAASLALPARFLQAVEADQTPGHHATAFGAVGAALQWSEAEMARAYLYSACAGLAAATLRLLPLGQLAGQRILWALLPEISRLAEEIQGKDMTDIWSFAPAIEIAAMRHAMLDARLFRS